MGKIKWIGHMQRTNKWKMSKKLFSRRPIARRKVSRWIDGVEWDLQRLGVDGETQDRL